MTVSTKIIADFLSTNHVKELIRLLPALLRKKPKNIHFLFSRGAYTFLDRTASDYIGLLELHLVTFPKSRVDNIEIGDIIWLPHPDEETKLLELVKVVEVRSRAHLNYYTVVCLDILTKDKYTERMKKVS